MENVYPQLINKNSLLPTGFGTANGTLPNISYSQLVNGADSMWINQSTLAASGTAPRIEVHQNPAFLEDDEGIAESGL